MIINLNNTCRVILTDFGARYYNYWHAFLGKKAPPDKKEGEVLEVPLWEIMHIFGGDAMWHGMDKVPFKDNKIELL